MKLSRPGSYGLRDGFLRFVISDWTESWLCNVDYGFLWSTLNRYL